MKTFRLCSLTIFIQEETKPISYFIPLKDGLIINITAQDDHWLIEAIIEKKFKRLFDDSKKNKWSLLAEATITSKDNPPAFFSVTVRESKIIHDQVQILLDGKRLLKKENYSEVILKDLIDQGLTGQELLIEFIRLKRDVGHFLNK